MHVEGGIVVHSLGLSATSLAFVTVWLCCQCQERRRSVSTVWCREGRNGNDRPTQSKGATNDERDGTGLVLGRKGYSQGSDSQRGRRAPVICASCMGMMVEICPRRRDDEPVRVHAVRKPRPRRWSHNGDFPRSQAKIQVQDMPDLDQVREGARDVAAGFARWAGTECGGSKAPSTSKRTGKSTYVAEATGPCQTTTGVSGEWIGA
jgi:hypothetical protein